MTGRLRRDGGWRGAPAVVSCTSLPSLPAIPVPAARSSAERQKGQRAERHHAALRRSVASCCRLSGPAAARRAILNPLPVLAGSRQVVVNRPIDTGTSSGRSYLHERSFYRSSKQQRSTTKADRAARAASEPKSSQKEAHGRAAPSYTTPRTTVATGRRRRRREAGRREKENANTRKVNVHARPNPWIAAGGVRVHALRP